MSARYATTLDAHFRGDTFIYTGTLAEGYTGLSFTGGMKFTLRRHIPSSGTTTDDAAIAQGSVTTGHITFSGQMVTVTFSGEATNDWPAALLYWDLQGVISGAPDIVQTIDAGTIQIVGDVTRST
jgi:hypothetical protein